MTRTDLRPPLPPFTREAAIQKVRLAENAWNSRDPQRVSLAYTVDSQSRNRADFPAGREEIVAVDGRLDLYCKPLPLTQVCHHGSTSSVFI